MFMAIWWCLQPVCFGFWIWTPEEKKLQNPKWTAKLTPQEQLKYGQSFFDAQEYKKAIVEFRRLLKHFPKALEAAEAQYYLGRSYEELDNPYAAYLAYQKVIDKYPFSEKMNQVLEREFEIAGQLTEIDKKFLGMTFSRDSQAIEVYRQIIDNAPYSTWAPLSQYKVGLTFKSLGRFDEAKVAFEKVLENYPESEWAEAAKFQIALSASDASLDASYDQELTQEAKQRFEAFLKKHPEAELSEKAQSEITYLTSKEAEKEFSVAQFYEKQRAYKSALIYYDGIIKTYPKTVWAQRAMERIQILNREDITENQ